MPRRCITPNLGCGWPTAAGWTCFSIRAVSCTRIDRGRQALISCGAVLDHLRVPMAADRWKAHVNRLPSPNNPEHLARVEFTRADDVTDDQRRRADAILKRRTDRLPFLAPTNWESFEPVLCTRVHASRVCMDVLSDDLRPRLAEGSQLTESLRLYDSSYHSELDWWTGPFEASGGHPVQFLGDRSRE